MKEQINNRMMRTNDNNEKGRNNEKK